MAENKTKEGLSIPDELEQKIERANQYLIEAREEAEKFEETKNQTAQQVVDLVNARELAKEKLGWVEKNISEAEAVLVGVNDGIKTASGNLSILNDKIATASLELEGLEKSKSEIKEKEKATRELIKELSEKEKKLDEGIEKVKQALETLK